MSVEKPEISNDHEMTGVIVAGIKEAINVPAVRAAMPMETFLALTYLLMTYKERDKDGLEHPTKIDFDRYQAAAVGEISGVIVELTGGKS